MNEDKVTCTIIKSVCLAFCILVTTIGGCTAHAHYLIQESIKSGADPIKASCAIVVGNPEAICIAAILKDKKDGTQP